MNFPKSRWLSVVIFLAVSVPALARPPIRQTTDNGLGSRVGGWTLMGMTAPITLTAGGNVVTMTRQIVCPFNNGDPSDLKQGGCKSGQYMYLFQIQIESSSTGVIPITIGNLQGFSPNNEDFSGNYGVMICEDPTKKDPVDGNDLELCTEDSDAPNYPELADITAQTGKTSVSFTINAPFPSFTHGPKPEEGQGLTFFVITQQTAEFPIAYPTIGD
jgi:hypothetical protein